MKIATNTEDDCAELMRYFQNRGPLSKALSLSKQVLDSADKTRGSYLSTMFDKLNIFADLVAVLAHVRERDNFFRYGGKAYRAIFADTG
ncbi:MAG: hypothetical protein ACLRSW_13935 [Christensenellaceae bacterium]